MSLPPHLLKLQKTQTPSTTSFNIQKKSESKIGNNSTNFPKSERKRIKKIKNFKKLKRKWKIVRNAGGEIWEDPTLEEWPENDYRIFCGDLGNEVSDEILSTAFKKYSSFNKARVVRDKGTGKSRGYGFVSIGDAGDYIKAMREMNGKYVGNRPIKLKRSTWKERCLINSNSKIEAARFKKNKTKIRKNVQMNPEMVGNSYPMNNIGMAYQGMTNDAQISYSKVSMGIRNPMINPKNFLN